jgi:universal stress protein A
MAIYRKVLAVLDLSDDSVRVGARALEIASGCGGAEVMLLHVVEYMPVEPLSDSLLPALQIETELLERARTRLQTVADTLQNPAPRWQVASGNVKAEIVRVAREGAFDLIVIGSHERHGLSILVNLTEDTVLHNAPCDVLAVRLPNSRSAP